MIAIQQLAWQEVAKAKNTGRLVIPKNCQICGITEFNHWLPQMFAERPEIAPEWDTWANVGAPLCRHHHALWHRIVTPYMPGIGQSRT